MYLICMLPLLARKKGEINNILSFSHRIRTKEFQWTNVCVRVGSNPTPGTM